jgi:nucleoside-diphosphate-sugar epimerase
MSRIFMQMRSGASTAFPQSTTVAKGAPKIVLRAIGLFNPAIREIIEMLYEFEEPFVVDDSRFKQEFGDHATPLREAIQRTVRWYREERPAGT